jgi:hypothetical protein
MSTSGSVTSPWVHGHHLGQVAHPGMGIRRGPRRVKLDRFDQTRGRRAFNIGRIGAFGEVKRHQGLERHAPGQRGEDAVPVGRRVGQRHHRRYQVRHDDRAGEMAGGFGQYGLQHRAVAQVQVPVIGAGQGDRLHGPGR